jgi:hypothetical protein
MASTGEHMRLEEPFHWGLLVEVVRRLRDLGRVAPAFVDWEVLPHFDGRSEDIFVWFIRDTRAMRSRFAAEALASATEAFRALAGLPEAAVRTLTCDVTSLEDIEAGGGRFLFFR